MGIAHIESSKLRWANTSPEERARLGAIHSKEVKKYWAKISPEERSLRAAKAAKARWAKKKI